MACKHRERTKEGAGQNRKRTYAKAYGKLTEFSFLHSIFKTSLEFKDMLTT